MDTSVLINFLHVNAVEILAHYSHQFLITDHVVAEITDYDADQRARLEKALHSGVLEQISLNTDADLRLFAKLIHSGRLGAGECAAIACAIQRTYKLAVDDRLAISEARKLAPKMEIKRTQDLVVSMIQEKLLTLQEADRWKAAWETNHRFKLKIDSFLDLL